MSMVKRVLSSGVTVIYHVLNNDFFYSQLVFALIAQKDSYAFFICLPR